MQTLYFETDSYLHRLNPLSKLLVTLPFMALMLMVSDPWTPLAFILLSIGSVLVLGRIPWKRAMRILMPLLWLSFAFILFYPFLIRSALVAETPVLLQVGPITLYQGGLYLGLVTGLRVFALLALSLPFSLTSDSADFVRSLVQQAHLPYRIGYSALAAFRFVPLFQNEITVIRAAQRVRGVNGGQGIRGSLERMRRSAVPLLATAIRQAERTALAMDARAFGAQATRTYFRRMRFTRADAVFVGGAALVSGAILLGLKWAGFLGPLAFFQIL